mmetsp:Transcript_19201/g.52756  ORF Transcript_19201/g.52756 Transcript_19201/m.52756 type:complete len:241 (-) Transcript_19201:3682-4404(-)
MAREKPSTGEILTAVRRTAAILTTTRRQRPNRNPRRRRPLCKRRRRALPQPNKRHPTRTTTTTPNHNENNNEKHPQRRKQIPLCFWTSRAAMTTMTKMTRSTMKQVVTDGIPNPHHASRYPNEKQRPRMRQPNDDNDNRNCSKTTIATAAIQRRMAAMPPFPWTTMIFRGPIRVVPKSPPSRNEPMAASPNPLAARQNRLPTTEKRRFGSDRSRMLQRRVGPRNDDVASKRAERMPGVMR